MLKDAAGVAGAALIFSPVGMPLVVHGIAGLIVGNVSLFLVESFLREIGAAVDQLEPDESPDAVSAGTEGSRPAAG